MTKRPHAWTALVISAVALGLVDAAEAGTTPPAPPVRVVVPHDARGNPLEPDDLPGPPPEVVKSPAKLEVPAVPSFELPAVEAGFHGPRELRVRGQSVLGAESKVKGYVTSIYDCAAELVAANPRATRAQVVAAIDKDPLLCERPIFFAGDTKTTSRDASIWVVDVPPPPGKAARDGQPSAAKPSAMPRIAVGSYVVVTGTWVGAHPSAG